MSFRSWAGIALVILVVGILALRAWGVAGIVSIIPTTDDVAEALEPEPYEEIEPVVIASIVTWRASPLSKPSKAAPSHRSHPPKTGRERRRKCVRSRTHLQRESGDCRSGAVPGCETLESRLQNRAGLRGKSMGKTKAAAPPRKSDFSVSPISPMKSTS